MISFVIYPKILKNLNKTFILGTRVLFNSLSSVSVSFQDCSESLFSVESHLDSSSIERLRLECKTGHLPNGVYAVSVGNKFEVVIGWSYLYWAHQLHPNISQWPLFLVNSNAGKLIQTSIAHAIDTQVSPMRIARRLQEWIVNGYSRRQLKALLKGQLSAARVDQFVRLCQLHPKIQDLLEQELLTFSVARALCVCSFEQQLEFSQKVTTQKLSSRKLEMLIKRSNGTVPELTDEDRVVSKQTTTQEDQAVKKFTDDLSERSGAPTQISRSNAGDSYLDFAFYSREELENINTWMTQEDARPNFKASLTIDVKERESLKAIEYALKDIKIGRGRLRFHFKNNEELTSLTAPFYKNEDW